MPHYAMMVTHAMASRRARRQRTCASKDKPSQDDGDLCNGLETCDPIDGTCEAGTSIICDNGNACDGEEACDATTGQCTYGIAIDCDDANPCNGVEACNPVNGSCTPGIALDEGAACGDSSPCTGPQTCVAGSCIAAAPVECPAPTNPCLVAFCDDMTGGCAETAAPLGTPCDDNDPCTETTPATQGCVVAYDPHLREPPPGVLCNATGDEGSRGHCELHVWRAHVKPSARQGPYSSISNGILRWLSVTFHRPRARSDDHTALPGPALPDLSDTRTASLPPATSSTCDAHPAIEGLCLSYTHLYNTGPGSGAQDWDGAMTIFVYTNGAPSPVVSGSSDRTKVQSPHPPFQPALPHEAKPRGW